MLSDEQIKELQSYYGGFHSEDTDDVCDNCEKHPDNHRLWWESGGFEYPHDGYSRCDDCGYKALHKYDDFDEKEVHAWLKAGFNPQ